MTLLEQLISDIRGAVCESGDVADHIHEAAGRRAAEQVLRTLLTPTQSMVNRMGAKALAGPQPAVGASIYPGPMWQAGVRYILEEQDREPEAGEEAPEGETEEQA